MFVDAALGALYRAKSSRKLKHFFFLKRRNTGEEPSVRTHGMLAVCCNSKNV